MQILNTFLAAGMIALVPTVTVAAEADWIADYDEAVKVAKAEGKDLLVDFTGSDWCGWCITLHEEVFSFEEFETYATEHFVLVALDFPKAQEIMDLVPNPARNKELAAKFGVTGYPTILLITPEGDVFGRTGYKAGGPAKYVEHLTEMLASGKVELAASSALVTEWAAATDENRTATWMRVMDTYEGLSADSVGSAPLLPIIREGLTLDPDNKAGMKLRAIKALLRAGQGDEEMLSTAEEMDPKNEAGLYELVVKAQCDNVRAETDLADAVSAVLDLDKLGIQDQDIALKMYTNCAFWSWKFLDNSEDARFFVDKARATGKADQDILDMLNDIMNDIGTGVEEPAE